MAKMKLGGPLVAAWQKASTLPAHIQNSEMFFTQHSQWQQKEEKKQPH